MPVEIAELSIPEIGRVSEKRPFRTWPNGSIEFASQVDFPAIDDCDLTEDETDLSVDSFEPCECNTEPDCAEPAGKIVPDDDEPATVKYIGVPHGSEHPLGPRREDRFMSFLPSARV